MRPTTVMQMERHACHVSTLGPRVLLELLTEIGVRNHCLHDVAERLSDYARLTPDMVRVTGADRMVPRRLLSVPA
jgi:hypothetical protein